MQQPHNDEAERSLLGTFFLDPDFAQLFSDYVKADYPDTRDKKGRKKAAWTELFFSPKHRTIARAIWRLHDLEEPTDLVTMVDALGEDFNDVGGMGYLTHIAASVVAPQNALFHWHSIEENWKRRQLIELGGEIIEAARAGQERSDEIIATVGDRCAALSPRAGARAMRDVSLDSDEGQRRLQEIIDDLRKGKVTQFVPSTINGFNHEVGGFPLKGITLVQGESKLGKTTFGVDQACHAALWLPPNMPSRRVIYCTFEDEIEAIQFRIAANLCCIPLGDFYRPPTRERAICAANALELVKDQLMGTKLMPLDIIHCGDPVTSVLVNRIDSVVQRTGGTPAMVVIDYGQRLRTGDTRIDSNYALRQSQVASECLRDQIIGAYGCAVLLLSQDGLSEDRSDEDRRKRRRSGAMKGDGGFSFFKACEVPLYIDRPAHYDREMERGLIEPGELNVRTARKSPRNVDLPIDICPTYQRFSDKTCMPGKVATQHDWVRQVRDDILLTTE